MYTRTRCNDRQRVRFSLSGRVRPTLRSNRRDDLPVERRQFLGTRLGRCLQGGWILPGVEQPQAGSQAGQPKPFEVSLVPELRVDRGQPLAKLCSPRSAAGTHVGEVGGELSGGVRHGRNLALAAGGLNRALPSTPCGRSLMPPFTSATRVVARETARGARNRRQRSPRAAPGARPVAQSRRRLSGSLHERAEAAAIASSAAQISRWKSRPVGHSRPGA
jgi:hypothetical protein